MAPLGRLAAGFAIALFLSSCRGIVQVSRPPDPMATKVDANSRPRVYLVMFENQEFEKIIGNPNAPYLNSLADRYAIATNFYANTHPSIGDYFMLTTGNIVTNDLFYSLRFDGDNLARELGKQGVTWRAYLESLPSVGYEKDRAFPYVRSHNPFSYFTDIHFIDEQKNNMVPITQLSDDLANGALPSFNYIVPNQQDNMHDCPPTMAPATCTNDDKLKWGDDWLRNTIEPILNLPSFQKDGLMIIAWDESWDNDSRNGGGRIPIILVGPNVKHGYQGDGFMQHEAILRLMCEVLQVPNTLGAAASAPSMHGYLIKPPPSGGTQTPPP